MSAGTMREYVKVITPTVTDDGTGGQTVDAVQPEFFFAFASVRPLSSRELSNAGSVQAIGTHVIELQYRPGVNTKQVVQLVESGLTFEIVGVVDPDRKQRILELSCVEVD